METWPVRLETELQGFVRPGFPPDPAPLSVQDPPTHTDTLGLSLGLWSEPGPAGRAAPGGALWKAAPVETAPSPAVLCEAVVTEKSCS